jgi:hypothetical protein
MAPPHTARPAPGVSGSGPREDDHAGQRDGLLDGTSKSKTQACERCCRAMPARSRGKAGRTRRFCSTTCRVAFSREKRLRNRSGYNHPCCYEIGSKTHENSKACEAKKEHPYPSGLSVPLDILGRGRSWSASKQIDRATWEQILWREVCAP